MNESDRAVVRACLDQIELGMTEAREVKTWWSTLSDSRQQEWKVFAASVSLYRRVLKEPEAAEVERGTEAARPGPAPFGALDIPG